MPPTTPSTSTPTPSLAKGHSVYVRSDRAGVSWREVEVRWRARGRSRGRRVAAREAGDSDGRHERPVKVQ